jgi:large subunit ribosomal protein L37Ae
MTTKSKKSRASGRFGARYGKKVREKLTNVEDKQRKKQKCPTCSKLGAKRLSPGIWQCTRKTCNKKFTGGAYYLE